MRVILTHDMDAVNKILDDSDLRERYNGTAKLKPNRIFFLFDDFGFVQVDNVDTPEHEVHYYIKKDYRRESRLTPFYFYRFYRAFSDTCERLVARIDLKWRATINYCIKSGFEVTGMEGSKVVLKKEL